MEKAKKHAGRQQRISLMVWRDNIKDLLRCRSGPFPPPPPPPRRCTQHKKYYSNLRPNSGYFFSLSAAARWPERNLPPRLFILHRSWLLAIRFFSRLSLPRGSSDEREKIERKLSARQQAFCLMDFISAANLFVFLRAKTPLASSLDANGRSRLAHKSNNFYEWDENCLPLFLSLIAHGGFSQLNLCFLLTTRPLFIPQL